MNAVCMTNDPSTKQHFGAIMARRYRGGAFCAFAIPQNPMIINDVLSLHPRVQREDDESVSCLGKAEKLQFMGPKIEVPLLIKAFLMTFLTPGNIELK